ncbi:MAG: glycine--tRNA ligase subunit alpha, partial [Thermodesulfovibrionia bacterium]|nr:glycine--tRNA ligase subunit alpha [Thermodesulfovibrionia bacterium]
EFSKYNFDEADIEMHLKLFEIYERESKRLLTKGLTLPSYDFCLKCSHTFNMLDARGALSVTERTAYIARVRNLSKLCAEGYLRMRKSMGFPLLKNQK